MITFDDSEVRKLSATLEVAQRRIGAATSAAVRASAERVKAAAQSAVPVRTGSLRGSIGVDYYGDGRSVGVTAVVGPSAYYGRFVEHGTSKMAAEPFMAPAYEAESPAFADSLAKAASEVLS